MFEVVDAGREYLFIVPNQAIIDFLGEMVDCPAFVLENADTFKEIAAKMIKEGPEPYVIDYQTIMDNFY